MLLLANVNCSLRLIDYYLKLWLYENHCRDEELYSMKKAWRNSGLNRIWTLRGQGFESHTSLNFFRLSFCNCKSCIYNCDDLLSFKTITCYKSSTLLANYNKKLMFSLAILRKTLRLSGNKITEEYCNCYLKLWIHENHCRDEELYSMKKAWRNSGLNRIWTLRGQGFESHTSLNFFRLSFCNCKSCIYNCDDLLSFKTITCYKSSTLLANYNKKLMFSLAILRETLRLSGNKITEEYCNWGHLDKAGLSDNRKITIHSKRVGCGLNSCS